VKQRRVLGLIVQGIFLVMTISTAGCKEQYVPSTIIPHTPPAGGTSIASPQASIVESFTPAPRIKVAESQHFVFFVDDSNVDLVIQTDKIEQVYDYVTRRAGNPFGGKIGVTFSQTLAQPCPVRGMATWPDLQITIYADGEVAQDHILAVIAHEMGHLIQFQYFDGGPIDPILLEGWATWVAGSYWIEWQGISSFDEGVRSYLRDKRFCSISRFDISTLIYKSEECLERRDIVYTEYASFLNYLIEQYGINALNSLITANIPTSPPSESADFRADYQATYGKTLQELEDDWIKYLRGGN